MDGAGFDLASLDLAGLELVPGPLRIRSAGGRSQGKPGGHRTARPVTPEIALRRLRG